MSGRKEPFGIVDPDEWYAIVMRYMYGTHEFDVDRGAGGVARNWRRPFGGGGLHSVFR